MGGWGGEGVGGGKGGGAVLQLPPGGRAGHSVLTAIHMQGLCLPQAGETGGKVLGCRCVCGHG